MLGSGLGDFASQPRRTACRCRYDELPHWPASGVVGHEGRLVVGTVEGRTIAALSGRCHLYEGHDMRTVTFAVRALGLLGVKTLILTNAAGGVNTGLRARRADGDRRSHQPDGRQSAGRRQRRAVRSALSGHDRGLFARVSAAWPTTPAATAASRCRTASTPALLGPSYETPAEIRYLRTIGADAVGMSTVPEAIAARHMGIEVLGISCITNMAAGVLPQPLDHREVMETARRVRGQFIALLEGIIGRI